MFAVIFICGDLFLRIAGKIAKIAKIRTRKNFLPHGKTQSETDSDSTNTISVTSLRHGQQKVTIMKQAMN